LSENSVVGPRASGFSPGKDGEAGDIGFIVDAAHYYNAISYCAAAFMASPDIFLLLPSINSLAKMF